MPFVHHPDFPDDVREVADEKVDEFVSAGWVKVSKADEKKIAAESPIQP